MPISRERLMRMPPTVRIRPRIAASASEVWTASCASFRSFAPRYCATTTPAPTAMP